MELTANQIRLLQAADAVLNEAPGATSPEVREIAQSVSQSLRGDAHDGQLSPGQRSVQEMTGNVRDTVSPDPNETNLSPGMRSAAELSPS